MGRPAARLETMVLVKRLYVVVYFVRKSRWLSLYEWYLLIYDDTPVFLTEIVY